MSEVAVGAIASNITQDVAFFLRTQDIRLIRLNLFRTIFQLRNSVFFSQHFSISQKHQENYLVVFELLEVTEAGSTKFEQTACSLVGFS